MSSSTGKEESKTSTTAAAAAAGDSKQAAVVAPRLGAATSTTLTVTWKPIAGADAYAVQMSQDPSLAEDGWKLLSTALKTCAVRKKNLEPASKYFFRVRAVSSAGEWASSWSPPSEAISTSAGVNPIFRNLLGHKLLHNAVGKPGKANQVDLNELGDGLVALYFSASWCPPCRQFTPMLVQFHASVRQAMGPGKFEVVFVSSDRDASSFNEYFANHHGNWYALPFEAQTQRQQCGAYFKVEGIPRLIVFGPSGKVVCANAVGERLDMSTLARWQKAAGIGVKT